jgi:glycosyltransferase involved in cell wall biosynthesis|tara:strand:- start:1235 stop:2425 length:1191 start_codon:yes stop_codon:yes gene_type:complete
VHEIYIEHGRVKNFLVIDVFGFGVASCFIVAFFKVVSILKIIHVFSSLDFGGVETHATKIAKCSDLKNEMTPVFCAISKGGHAEKKIMEYGCEVVVLSSSSKIPSLKAFFKLLHYFRQVKPCVVHAHGAEANFHGILAAFFARVPVRIGEEIGIPDHSKLAKKIFKFIYSLSTQVVAISDSVKAWLIDSGEVPKAKVTRIYNPVEVTHKENYIFFPKNKFRIAFVGRLEPVKNPLALISAVSLLRKNNIPIELWMVGDGSLMQDCLSLISDLEMGDAVFMHGYCDEPASLIVQCDLYVQPSITEGFGIALVEAMLCKVPVLATSVGGAPEIIRHGENGWLADNTDGESLSLAINDILNLTDDLRSFGERAYQSVCDRFKTENYINELLSLYEKMAK